jgi:hypothetical protein
MDIFYAATKKTSFWNIQKEEVDSCPSFAQQRMGWK